MVPQELSARFFFEIFIIYSQGFWRRYENDGIDIRCNAIYTDPQKMLCMFWSSDKADGTKEQSLNSTQVSKPRATQAESR